MLVDDDCAEQSSTTQRGCLCFHLPSFRFAHGLAMNVVLPKEPDFPVQLDSLIIDDHTPHSDNIEDEALRIAVSIVVPSAIASAKWFAQVYLHEDASKSSS